MDILATEVSARDISATENAKDGCFSHNHKLGVGVCACVMHFLGLINNHLNNFKYCIFFQIFISC